MTVWSGQRAAESSPRLAAPGLGNGQEAPPMWIMLPCLHRVVQKFLVPTLGMGTPVRTLRVPTCNWEGSDPLRDLGGGAPAAAGTQSVRTGVPTPSVGTRRLFYQAGATLPEVTRAMGINRPSLSTPPSGTRSSWSAACGFRSTFLGPVSEQLARPLLVICPQHKQPAARRGVPHTSPGTGPGRDALRLTCWSIRAGSAGWGR